MLARPGSTVKNHAGKPVPVPAYRQRNSFSAQREAHQPPLAKLVRSHEVELAVKFAAPLPASGERATFWMGDSLERLRGAPVDIRSDEIRVHGGSEYRIFYVARFAEAVYVLHCFVKKTRATRQADMDLGRHRYGLVLEKRKSK
jgi:hypothetical protein